MAKIEKQSFYDQEKKSMRNEKDCFYDSSKKKMMVDTGMWRSRLGTAKSICLILSCCVTSYLATVVLSF
jgi:hypothetical protein